MVNAPNKTLGRPAQTDAAPYHFTYISQVAGEDILSCLEGQQAEAGSIFTVFTEATSLQRYAPGKWSVREVLNHITDTERLFTFRALWIARGLNGALLSFDQQTAATHAEADHIPLARHLEEFRSIRSATVALFANLPASAWDRPGIVADHRFTPRALAFITAGHLTHHLHILRERYTSR